MRILADENVPGAAIDELRLRGHDVVWVRVSSPGSPDEANLAEAVSQQRLLITFDKDYGELIYRLGNAASCGVVLFRISAPTAKDLAKIITDILDSRADWIGNYSVVDSRRIRIKPLPGAEPLKPR